MGVMKIGRRLAIKVLNASKFALGRSGRPLPGIERPDPARRGAAGPAGRGRRNATTAHDGYDYARALEVTERFFWSFCDDYVELVKTRAYGEGDPAADSARATLALALVGPAPPLRALPALRHRGGLELVA